MPKKKKLSKSSYLSDENEEKMKLTKKQIDFIYLIMIFLLMAFMLFVVFYMISNKEAFIDNPFIYGASKQKGDVYCLCIQTIGEEKFMFKFNKTDWWSEPVEQYWMQ